MKHIVLGFMLLASLRLLGQTCASQSTSDPVDDGSTSHNSLRIADSAEHVNGSHGVIAGSDTIADLSTLAQQCTYSGQPTSGYCNAQCDVVNINGTSNPLTGFSPIESGKLSTLIDLHQVALFWQPGHNAANGPTSAVACTGIFAYAVASCASGGCGMSITGLSIGPGGVTVNVSETNDVISRQGLPVPFSCPLVGIGGGGGGGSCTPNPTNPFQIAPVADLGVKQTDPGDPPPPCTVSPIIIDVEGEGFHLTSAAQGVVFDIRGDGHPIQMAWTAAGFRNAFLTLPGSDGLVHNGKELFGDFTQQPKSFHPNGFLALAEYDKPENGGNGDGIIDEHDAVFSNLRLWIDENHDGISQPGEMHTLSELGIRSLALGYFESRKADEFGNEFRYKARINPRHEHRDSRDEAPDGTPGRWAYDVYFVIK
jgi:hypothetical protein